MTSWCNSIFLTFWVVKFDPFCLFQLCFLIKAERIHLKVVNYRLSFRIFAVQYGEVDRMVAGGCEATVDAWTIASFARIRALATNHNATPHLASRPFDCDREGFVMAEGAGALVLEVWPPPPSSHLSSKPPIAEIIGFGRSCKCVFKLSTIWHLSGRV